MRDLGRSSSEFPGRDPVPPIEPEGRVAANDGPGRRGHRCGALAIAPIAPDPGQCPGQRCQRAPPGADRNMPLGARSRSGRRFHRTGTRRRAWVATGWGCDLAFGDGGSRTPREGGRPVRTFVRVLRRFGSWERSCPDRSGLFRRGCLPGPRRRSYHSDTTGLGGRD